MFRRLRIVALAGLIVSAACAGTGEPSASGSDASAMAGHDMPELPATDGPGFTVADVRFMQGMISHHAQAIAMAALAPTHGAGDRLLRFAQKIDISQRDEIELMQDWLRYREQAVPDSMQVHMMMMPGMLTPEQLAQLDQARGAEFERLFLTFMIQHHQGALTMVDSLLASPGAANDSDIFRFITDVQLDQSAEIDVMWTMLDAIPGSDSR